MRDGRWRWQPLQRGLAGRPQPCLVSVGLSSSACAGACFNETAPSGTPWAFGTVAAPLRRRRFRRSAQRARDTTESCSGPTIPVGLRCRVSGWRDDLLLPVAPAAGRVSTPDNWAVHLCVDRTTLAGLSRSKVPAFIHLRTTPLNLTGGRVAGPPPLGRLDKATGRVAKMPEVAGRDQRPWIPG